MFRCIFGLHNNSRKVTEGSNEWPLRHPLISRSRQGSRTRDDLDRGEGTVWPAQHSESDPAEQNRKIRLITARHSETREQA